MIISIIIVNFNAGELIFACIESIINNNTLKEYEIIVVDNDSTDHSVQIIKENFPEVKVIETGKNLGFSAGNNIGFKAATGDYILVLNPDTLVINNAIEKCVTYLKSHPEVGMLGCKVLSETGERQSTLMKFLRLQDILINIFIPYKWICNNQWLGKRHYEDLDHNHSYDVEVIVGCFMMLPRTLLNQVGGFDEDFFMYVEEVEWCWRVYQTGKKIRYYPDSQIIHYGGGCSSSLSHRKTLLMAKGTLMFFEKTRGNLISVLANLLMIIRDLPRMILWMLFRLVGKESTFLRYSSIRLIYLLQYLLKIEKEI